MEFAGKKNVTTSKRTRRAQFQDARRDLKRAAAAERNAVCTSLTVAQRIERLDRKLGKGIGARKERARLANVK